MEGCYKDSDAKCLQNAYEWLVLGAKAKGWDTASLNMNHFLHGKGRDLEIGSEEILSSDAASQAADEMLNQFLAEAVAFAYSNGEGVYNLTDPDSVQVTALDDQDLWYGLGTFTLDATGSANISLTPNGDFEIELTVDYTVTDEYDWHPGLAAGGAQPGINNIPDDWGQFLVDQGKAHTFSMSSHWEVTRTYLLRP